MTTSLIKINTKTRGVFNLEGNGEPFPQTFLTMAKRQNLIPYEPVGRIIQDSGAERVSHNAKVALAEYLEEYSLELGKLAVKYAKHAGRTTVTDEDIKLAEKFLDK